MVEVSLCSVYRAYAQSLHYGEYFDGECLQSRFWRLRDNPGCECQHTAERHDYICRPLLALFKSKSFIFVPILTKPRLSEESTNTACAEH